MPLRRSVIFCLASTTLLIATTTRVAGHAEIDVQILAVTKRIQQSPNEATLYFRRGELHRIHQEWLRAAADYARVEKLAPEFTAVDKARGQMLLEAGQPQHALVPLKRFLQRVPHNSDAHALRARAFVALKDNEAALADYNAAVTNATINAVNYYSERAQLLATMSLVEQFPTAIRFRQTAARHAVRNLPSRPQNLAGSRKPSEVSMKASRASARSAHLNNKPSRCDCDKPTTTMR